MNNKMNFINRITYNSNHYLFEVNKKSIAEKNIKNLVKIQEKCYLNFEKSFFHNNNLFIKYYVFDDPFECGKEYRNIFPEEYDENEPDEPINAFALYPNSIYCVYSEKIKCIGFHEDVHVFMFNKFGNINNNLLKEGIAMHFDKKWHGINNHFLSKYYLKNKTIDDLFSLTDNSIFSKYYCGITYPIAGSFCSFLIKSLGVNSFLEIYKNVKISVLKENMLKYLKYINDLIIPKLPRFLKEIRDNSW